MSAPRVTLPGVVLGPVLLLAGCSRDGALMLAPVGPQARRIDGLWSLYFPILVTVFVLVIVALLLSVLRSGPSTQKPEPPVVDPPPTVKEAPPAHAFLAPVPGDERKVHTVIWALTITTAVILFVLLVASYRTGRAIASLGEQNELAIKVTGIQWWWRLEYQDPDPSKIVETANELHIPVGRPVQLQLEAFDVIHSFWVPQLHGKRDLVPGNPAVIVLQADQPGEYVGQCAEFCGLQHAKMSLKVIAEPEAQFQAWLAAQRQPRPEPTDPLVKQGERVFLSGPCVMCHTIGGTIAGSRAGPDLTHVASRTTLAAGTVPNTRGHLAGWVLDPQGIKWGVHMPPNPMSSEDFNALLAYLESLK